MQSVRYCFLPFKEDESIKSVYDIGGYSLKGMDVYYSLHYSRVCRGVALQRKAKSKT